MAIVQIKPVEFPRKIGCQSLNSSKNHRLKGSFRIHFLDFLHFYEKTDGYGYLGEKQEEILAFISKRHVSSGNFQKKPVEKLEFASKPVSNRE